MTTYEERMESLKKLENNVDDILKDMNIDNVNDKLDECNKLLSETFQIPKRGKSIKRPNKKR